MESIISNSSESLRISVDKTCAELNLVHTCAISMSSPRKHYKPTDSHSYLLYSSSHPSHVKYSIPYSQFLRLRLCSDNSDFSLKSEEMCNFFNKRGYRASVVQAGHHRAQQIDRQSALQTSQRDNNDRIPFTLTFHPHNHAVKSIILKTLNYFKMIPILAESFRNLH